MKATNVNSRRTEVLIPNHETTTLPVVSIASRRSLPERRKLTFVADNPITRRTLRVNDNRAVLRGEIEQNRCVLALHSNHSCFPCVIRHSFSSPGEVGACCPDLSSDLEPYHMGGPGQPGLTRKLKCEAHQNLALIIIGTYHILEGVRDVVRAPVRVPDFGIDMQGTYFELKSATHNEACGGRGSNDVASSARRICQERTDVTEIA
jgi:hypothetical protein